MKRLVLAWEVRTGLECRSGDRLDWLEVVRGFPQSLPETAEVVL
jgi:hypothetical protein